MSEDWSDETATMPTEVRELSECDDKANAEAMTRRDPKLTEGLFSCEKYIQYHRQPHSRYMTMAEFNAANNTMMWDTNVENAVREQHKYSEEYQDFEMVRTDLWDFERRKEYFKV